MRARSMIVGHLRAPNDCASRSHSTSPLPPLCTPATQATSRLVAYSILVNGLDVDQWCWLHVTVDHNGEFPCSLLIYLTILIVTVCFILVRG